MKTKLSAIVLIALIASFAAGWSCGQRSTAKLAGNVLQAQEFNKAYVDLAQNDAVIEELDAGKMDDAKYMLLSHEGGAILTMENTLTISPPASPAELKELNEFNKSVLSRPPRETADKILARIAARRAQHPWTYHGTFTNLVDPGVDAKLDAIPKQAAENQKNYYTNANFRQ